MEKFQAERVLKLAAFIEELPKNKLNMSKWLEESPRCGTVACAAGWAGTIRSFRDAGFTCNYAGPSFCRTQKRDLALPLRTEPGGHLVFEVCANFFGMTYHEANNVFSGKAFKAFRPSPYAVAKKLRDIVAGYGLEVTK